MFLELDFWFIVLRKSGEREDKSPLFWIFYCMAWERSGEDYKIEGFELKVFLLGLLKQETFSIISLGFLIGQSKLGGS